MALTRDEILGRVDAQEPQMYTLSEELHVSADGYAVKAGDPRGAFVLGAAGRRIPLSLAREIGLKDNGATTIPEKPLTEAETAFEGAKTLISAQEKRIADLEAEVIKLEDAAAKWQQENEAQRKTITEQAKTIREAAALAKAQADANKKAAHPAPPPPAEHLPNAAEPTPQQPKANTSEADSA
jgi:hypothetical protein